MANVENQSAPARHGDGAGPDRRYLSAEELLSVPKPNHAAVPRPFTPNPGPEPVEPSELPAPPPPAVPRTVDHELLTRVATQEPYSLNERVAKGAESVLFKAVSGRHTFCAKAIRNVLGKTFGGGDDMQAEGKLADVSYANKTRHLRNEFEVGSHLREEGDIPIVRIYALRKVRRLGVELGYDLLMEYVEGEDMGEKAFLRSLTVEKKVDILHQTLKALAFLHYRRYVHMDMKPSNIMVNPDGIVKLIDFGVTVSQGQVPRAVTGTAGYLSPEQIVREHVDEATDMFALGITFAVIFGGRALRQTPEDLKSKHFRNEAKYHLDSVEQPAVAVFPELLSCPDLAQLLSYCTIPRRGKRLANTGVMIPRLERIAEDYGIPLTGVNV